MLSGIDISVQKGGSATVRETGAMSNQAEKRRPGRPKGSRNKLNADARGLLAKNGLAGVRALCAIAAGRPIWRPREADGRREKLTPDLDHMLTAQKAILNCLVPSLKATEITGQNGAPLIPEQESSPRHLARAIVALLGEGVPADDAGDDVPRATFELTAERFDPVDERAALDLSEPGTMPGIGERVLVGDKGCWIERQADGRWKVLHSDGFLHRFCRDRQEAERQAGALTW